MMMMKKKEKGGKNFHSHLKLMFLLSTKYEDDNVDVVDLNVDDDFHQFLFFSLIDQ